MKDSKRCILKNPSPLIIWRWWIQFDLSGSWLFCVKRLTDSFSFYSFLQSLRSSWPIWRSTAGRRPSSPSFLKGKEQWRLTKMERPLWERRTETQTWIQALTLRSRQRKAQTCNGYSDTETTWEWHVTLGFCLLSQVFFIFIYQVLLCAACDGWLLMTWFSF